MIVFRLKQLRKEKHITQIRLAIELGTNQNAISRYENETHEADYQTLIAIADYFNVSVDYLLGRTENRMVNR
jgi:transcriptional regulator with XRE-family HTH domain